MPASKPPRLVSVLRQRLVVRTLPGPVRRVEMQADEEWFSLFDVAIDRLDGLFGEQIRQVTSLVNFDIVVPEIVGIGLGAARLMREVVQIASAESPEMVVAALEGPIIRKTAEMPFAKKRSAVTGFSEQRRQRGMPGRKPYVAGAKRFLQADGQSVLIAARDQRDAAGGAYRRIGVSLQELHAFRGQPVDVRRFVIRTAIAGEIGITEIVGEDEQDVGRGRRCAAAFDPASRARGVAAVLASTCRRVGLNEWFNWGSFL